ATIVDFIDPIQYNLNIGPSVDAGPDQTRCSQGTQTAFPLNGVATAGLKPIASTTWTVVNGSATNDSPTSLVPPAPSSSHSPPSPGATAYVSSGSAPLRLIATQVNGCSETNDVVLNVSPLPACSITGPTLVCPRSSIQFHGPSGMSGYSWSISGNGSISGATN